MIALVGPRYGPESPHGESQGVGFVVARLVGKRCFHDQATHREVRPDASTDGGTAH